MLLGAPNPKLAPIVPRVDRELRVQRGTGIIELLVVLASEVRIRAYRKCWRASESDHWPE
jgi:hypothetical protein